MNKIKMKRREIFRTGISWVAVFILTLCFFRPAPAADEAMTLETCLKTAFENNLDIAQAVKAREEAMFRLKQAEARYFPEVGIDASTGYISELNTMRLGDTTVEPVPGMSVTIPGREIEIGDHEKTDLALSLVQPLYTGGSIRGGVKASEAALAATDSQMDLAKQQVRNQVITAFYRLAMSQELKKIAVAGKEQIESHLNDARNLLDQGMILKSDLLPIDIRRLETELKIVQAENAIEKARAVLAERMGLSPDTPIDIVVNGDDQPPWPIPSDFETEGHTRPEEEMVAQQIKAAGAEADIAAGALMPQVGFSVSGHYGYPGFVSNDPDWDTWWQAGVNVSWNIFDMGRRSNGKKAALSKEARLNRTKQAVDRQIALDRINTRLAYEEACRRLMIGKEKEEAARENFRTKEDSFKVGMTSNTDYLDAHTELMNSETELAVVSAEVRVAWADYNRALGVKEQDNGIAKETEP